MKSSIRESDFDNEPLQLSYGPSNHEIIPLCI
jgi:hypothetical protein